MARDFIGDGQDVYRVVVTSAFPDGSKTFVRFFGPYNSIGTARAQQTSHLNKPGVTDAQIQKAHIEWGDVL